MWYLKSLFITFCIYHSVASDCQRNEATKNDEVLHLGIIGEPNYFVPRSIYTVFLRSKQRFNEFSIFTESTDSGSIQLMNDGLTSYSEECMNSAVNSHKTFTQEVQVFWLSPLKGCHNLIAQVRLDEQWAFTNKTICSQDDDYRDTKEDEKCCACDHAKYKILFKGIWSPETHPKDFPKALEFTHFSDLIGASHSTNYTMWKEGGYASFGMKQLAEFGVVSDMEVELKRSAKYLKTLIKAAGLWYPNLNGNMTGTFRVDPRHHLVSLASMFGPSPDWIVGISGLNLCLDNCTWQESAEFDLYPYDAGTDNGITYMSIKSASDPQEKISKITSSYPDDRRSPFYDPEGKNLTPLAKLYITREKVIPRRCGEMTENELLEEISVTDNSEDENREECKVSGYSPWTPCAVSCGKGLRMRQRQYVNPTLAETSKCQRQLVAKEMCVQPKCPGDEEEEEPAFVVGECEVTTWTDWSNCSVTCGIGSRVRNRQFKNEDARLLKKCSDIALTDVAKCMLPPCFSNEKKSRRECSVTEWSEWSSCSTSCGKGEVVRVRNFKSEDAAKICHGVPLKETLPCSLTSECKIQQSDVKRICSLEPQKGPCRGEFKRWAFKSESKQCEPFTYGGCRGNRNNFETFEECYKTCSKGSPKSEQPVNEGKPRHCVVSKWSSWSPCMPCPNGTKSKSRTIVKEPLNGGKPCPPLTRTVPCNIPPEFCDIQMKKELQ